VEAAAAVTVMEAEAVLGGSAAEAPVAAVPAETTEESECERQCCKEGRARVGFR
jgi:hypothetical protein